MNDLPTYSQTAAAYNREPGIAPMFFLHEGRECVKVNIAGNMRNVSVFPAHATWTRNDFGEPITYAERWPTQYAQFKNGNMQTADGTPLTEAPFLNPSRIADLNAVKVFTLEGLATFDDRYISRLGGHGYKLKTMAQEFLAKRGTADTSANVEALLKQNNELMARLNAMQQVKSDDSGKPDDAYGDLDDAALKDRIEQIAGSRPRGNPSRATLIGMLSDLEQGEAA